jgi:hypothetical protein
MAKDLRAIAVTIGRVAGRVWLFIARRRVRPEDVRRASEALNRLRRRYVFGGVSREVYEAQMSAYRRLMPWQRRARTARKVGSPD